MIRCLLVDDNGPFLAAARATLERDGAAVVGTAASAAEAIPLAATLQPDVILVDIDLGDDNGFDLARDLAAVGSAPVVLISAYPESEFADLVAASPAVGFLAKADLSTGAVTALLGRGSEDSRRL
jgi:DNA-binding NarL/FixJ family response regulator